MKTIYYGNQQHQVPVTIYPDPPTLGNALAQTILQGIREAGRQGRRYLLGCPGGRSPQTTYQALGRLAAGQDADLSNLVIVMMDEYLLPGPTGLIYCPEEAHNSCHRFAREDILAVLNRDLPSPRQVTECWFPDPAAPTAYDERIYAAGCIDLFILASGASDGHVAFNPPGSTVDSASRIIPIADATRRDNMVTFPDFTSLDEVPTHGVSVGLGTIARLSKSAVLILHSTDKRYAVQRLASCADFTPDWPVSIIYRCREASILLDSAAAGKEGKQ
ncbi:MAG TPA: 6-phosphogluconolactonase [Armatimonadota bacterium]|jgi:glucosamine-6-phosphate deaminase